ncbi:hypothetical protein C8J57DRAFT_1528513 [Mycena rebaudengoi]|nr:hypothetical protein C8J57DRAFT_1528513 [Mycena rebaudengoi]
MPDRYLPRFRVPPHHSPPRPDRLIHATGSSIFPVSLPNRSRWCTSFFKICTACPSSALLVLFSTAPLRLLRLLTPHTLVRVVSPLFITSALTHRIFRPAYAQYAVSLKLLVLIQDRSPPRAFLPSLHFGASPQLSSIDSQLSGFWCSDALLQFEYFSHLSTRCIPTLPTASSHHPRLLSSRYSSPPHSVPFSPSMLSVDTHARLDIPFTRPRCAGYLVRPLLACALHAPSFPPPLSITTALHPPPLLHAFCAVLPSTSVHYLYSPPSIHDFRGSFSGHTRCCLNTSPACPQGASQPYPPLLHASRACSHHAARPRLAPSLFLPRCSPSIHTQA